MTVPGRVLKPHNLAHCRDRVTETEKEGNLRLRENNKSAEMETDRALTHQETGTEQQVDRNSKSLFFQQSQNWLTWQLKPKEDF